jgi:hypothetical protein
VRKQKQESKREKLYNEKSHDCFVSVACEWLFESKSNKREREKEGEGERKRGARRMWDSPSTRIVINSKKLREVFVEVYGHHYMSHLTYLSCSSSFLSSS